MWPANVSSSHIVTFIIVALLMSLGVAALVNRNPSLIGMSGIVYVIPTVVAIALNILHHKAVSNVYQPVFSGTTKQSILFAILYPAAFVIVIAAIALASGKAAFASGNLPSMLEMLAALVFTILLMVMAFGEEYGWRGFLLPALAARYGQLRATIIVGLIWAMYHLPADILVNKGSANPWLACLVQVASVFIMAFPLSYCYFQTKGSIAGVILFRAIWDIAHILVLGSENSEARTVLAGNYTLFNIIPLDLALGVIAAIAFACILARNDVAANEKA